MACNTHGSAGRDRHLDPPPRSCWPLWHLAMDLAATAIEHTAPRSTASRLGLAPAIRRCAVRLPPLVARPPAVVTTGWLAELRQAAALARQLETAVLLVQRLSAGFSEPPSLLRPQLREFQYLLQRLLETWPSATASQRFSRV